MVKRYEVEYEKIIITNADEQPYILFAGWYGYDPLLWQKGLKKVYVEGFGDLQNIDKFYFGQAQAEKNGRTVAGNGHINTIRRCIKRNKRKFANGSTIYPCRFETAGSYKIPIFRAGILLI